MLHVEHISKTFDNIKALSDVTFTVKKGELFGLIGPDGAGKTTLFRCILGLEKPTEGNIYIKDQLIANNKTIIKNNTGYLSQQFSLYEDLTVEENIDFFATLHTEGDFTKRKNELLEFTRMKPFISRLAGKLSGGMKQKLALACTLIHKPDIIFLDEPTTGVDPISRRDFWLILNELQKEGLTIVLATPYMDEAERCHRVAMIHHGHILTQSDPSSLKKELGKRVFEIVSSQPRKLAKIVQELFPSEDILLVGERIQVLSKESSGIDKDILKICEKEEIVITSQRWMMPSMENVFISRIKQEQII